jgi:hypothetical protein
MDGDTTVEAQHGQRSIALPSWVAAATTVEAEHAQKGTAPA